MRRAKLLLRNAKIRLHILKPKQGWPVRPSTKLQEFLFLLLTVASEDRPQLLEVGRILLLPAVILAVLLQIVHVDLIEAA